MRCMRLFGFQRTQKLLRLTGSFVFLLKTSSVVETDKKVKQRQRKGAEEIQTKHEPSLQ